MARGAGGRPAGVRAGRDREVRRHPRSRRRRGGNRHPHRRSHGALRGAGRPAATRRHVSRHRDLRRQHRDLRGDAGRARAAPPHLPAHHQPAHRRHPVGLCRARGRRRLGGARHSDGLGVPAASRVRSAGGPVCGARDGVRCPAGGRSDAHRRSWLPPHRRCDGGHHRADAAADVVDGLAARAAGGRRGGTGIGGDGAGAAADLGGAVRARDLRRPAAQSVRRAGDGPGPAGRAGGGGNGRLVAGVGVNGRRRDDVRRGAARGIWSARRVDADRRAARPGAVVVGHRGLLRGAHAGARRPSPRSRVPGAGASRAAARALA